ncbi:MAG: polymerase protein [Candidatus Levybacteria bacterium GW2011_GWC2_37_7]|nr:MAG: polymerase protein [Candidatus Levybacteria bacterium GW2011_GWC2_37_7]
MSYIFMEKLILIDGNAILHRAFHALPPLTNPDGIIVNAVYGFFSMFLKILEMHKPDFLIVCFDKKAPTFRKELFVGYQAKRPKMSDDLVPQIKFVHEILKKAKVEIFEVDGYEADDLIGTIANQSQKSKIKSQKEGIEVFIVSGDRDLLQLVNAHVKMIAPITGLTNMLIFDEASVLQKYGIKPTQMVDYKALVGDPSDNYPGVAGIGPKTAVTLINEYGSLEEIYKNLEKIKTKNPNLAMKLATDAEAAGLAQKLAGVVLDAPITLDMEKAKIQYLDREGMKEEFEKYGFKSLLNRLSDKRQATSDKETEKEKPKVEQMELL